MRKGRGGGRAGQDDNDNREKSAKDGTHGGLDDLRVGYDCVQCLPEGSWGFGVVVRFIQYRWAPIAVDYVTGIHLLEQIIGYSLSPLACYSSMRSFARPEQGDCFGKKDGGAPIIKHFEGSQLRAKTRLEHVDQ